MKKIIPALGPLVALTCFVSGAIAAEKGKSDVKQETRRMRILAGPEAGARPFHPGEPEAREKVTFLGVETAPASATLAAQLSLPKGAGLVVRSIVPESPAAGALQEHDILLKFEDQLLVEQRQLAVLIRQRKEGEEVALTVVRAGKQTTVKVKLGTHDVPKFGQFFGAPGEHEFPFEFEAGAFAFTGPDVLVHGPEKVDRVLSLIDRGGAGGPAIHLERQAAPGIRAMRVNPENSNLVFTDDKGSLELTVKDGEKTLVAKDAKGVQQFSGSVTRPEQRAAMPADVRARLEELEGMQDITFKTDGAFRGTETKIVRPLGRGVSLPYPARWVTPPTRSTVM